MKDNNILRLIIVLVLIVVFAYFGAAYYNSNEVIFNRYLDKITNIDVAEVKAIDVNIYKDGTIFKSYFDRQESYLMLDLLHEVKPLNQEKDKINQGYYAYRIRTAIETSESIYEVKIDVNETNYDFIINEITVNMNENKKIELTKYYKSNDKIKELFKKLLNTTY